MATLSLNPDRPRLANAFFVLDLNVDVIEGRIESEAAIRVLAGSFANLYRVAVTPEFVEELERHKKAGGDPVLSFATGLPTLPALPELFADVDLPRPGCARFAGPERRAGHTPEHPVRLATPSLVHPSQRHGIRYP